MMKKYDNAFIIMRAQIFTKGHIHLIKEAGKVSNSVVIILGSANEPRTFKNPFTINERKKVIRNYFNKNKPNFEITFDELEDEPINPNKFNKNLKLLIGGYADKGLDKQVLISSNKEDDHLKRESWLDNIIDVHTIEALKVANDKSISASYIREIFFDHHVDILSRFPEVIPKVTLDFLINFSSNNTFDYDRLCNEYYEIRDNQKKYGKGKFYTSDALIYRKTLNDEIEILTVVRGGAVGNGLYAMAGGFVDGNETYYDAIIRELDEELSIGKYIQNNIPVKKVKGYGFEDFFERDLRGDVRTMVHVFKFNENDIANVRIKAGDDAKEFAWKNINDLNNENMYSDHYHIIRDLL